MEKKFKHSIALVLVFTLTFSLLVTGTFASNTSEFTDIGDSIHAAAIQELNKAGIMSGIGGGKFAPDSTATRAMAVTVLGRLAGVEQSYPNSFTDVPSSSWYSNGAGWAASNGIVSNSSGRFDPNEPVTGEVLNQMLEQYAKLVNIEYVPENQTKDPLTRGELAEIAYHVYAMQYGTSGSQTVVMKGEDWGPAVYKTVLKLNQDVAASSVSKESFQVNETRESFSYTTFSAEVVHGPREVVAAYTSDEQGNRVNQNSYYITLEMAYDEAAGYPYVNNSIAQSRFSKAYDLSISLTDESTLSTVAGDKIKILAISSVNLEEALIPDIENVDLTGKFTGSDGKTLCYASYTPDNANDGSKHPLIIWIHGMGEGGEDPSIAILGNKVSALFKDEFQNLLGGAYVLAPQTPGFWLQYDENDLSKWGDNPGINSIYTTVLMELIENYVDNHPNIDADRIIIGGCSNGGYMTMNMVLKNPDYFAAAFPICEAYMDSGISDEQMEALKNLPMWFVWAENDGLVNPEIYEKPTIARLEKLDADVHSSIFETGGHASWIYFFNNQCEEDGINMWQWLAQQQK